MLSRSFVLVLLLSSFLVVSITGERARNDDLTEIEENSSEENSDEFVETIKRFLRGKKTTTTTAAPTAGVVSGLVPTKATIKVTNPTRSSFLDRDTVTKSTPKKEACGAVSPCKNGGTCKTLSSGNFYCFCEQDFYGKTCENKFMTSGGSSNADRAKVDHCAKSPCKNNGECVGLRTTFYCRCKLPFYGTICDKKISKREEIDDEELEAAEEYQRELEEDRDDLREIVGGQMK